MEDLEAMKTRFNDQVNTLKSKKGKNHQLFTKDEYHSFMNDVKKTKKKTSGKTPEDYQRLSRYDIVRIGNIERLIVPVKYKGNSIIMYTFLEENFEIIHKTHLAIGHGRRNKMMEELKKKYKNITTELVMIYLNLCLCCHNRIKRVSIPKKKLIIKPVNSRKLSSRCQIDLIDMRPQPDEDFKFIMLCQDQRTKFVQLKALKTKNAEEVAGHLLDVFTTFGAPCILESDIGQKFAHEVIKEICRKWDEPKIVHGKPSQGSVEKMKQDIKKMLSTWMEENKTTKWSEGIRFIQFEKNRAHNSVINCTPYEAMFGHEAKVGLKSPLHGLQEITKEEDLELILNNEPYNNFEPQIVISEGNDEGMWW